MSATYPDELRGLVEDALLRYFPDAESDSGPVLEAMRYSLFSGGKRFRPVLCVLVAQYFRRPAELVMPTACAIEFIHTYSLIHDDLPAIDDDDLRRGRPTCHVKFGEDIAILAGDALFAEAFRLVASEQEAPNCEITVRVLTELADSSGVRGMVGGQVVDVVTTSSQAVLSEDELRSMHARKTGRLISAAVMTAALICEASEDELQALTDYSRSIGMAFQITDDILDATGETGKLGKPAGSDLRMNKSTAVSVFGVERSRDLAREAADEAKDALGRLARPSPRLSDMADFVCLRES